MSPNVIGPAIQLVNNAVKTDLMGIFYRNLLCSTIKCALNHAIDIFGQTVAGFGYAGGNRTFCLVAKGIN